MSQNNRTSEAAGSDSFSHRSGYGEARYGGMDLASWLVKKGGASLSWDESLALAKEVLMLRKRIEETTEADRALARIGAQALRYHTAGVLMDEELIEAALNDETIFNRARELAPEGQDG